MANASKNSDIDLMVITKNNRLWQTRLKTLASLKRSGVAARRAGDANEKDRLCLNIWLDVADLLINQHNPYTAHELAQIVPLINRGKTYEKLLSANKWILDYWPNSVSIEYEASSIKLNTKYSILNTIFEKLVYLAQKVYMNRKKTREVVTPTRAMFHPMDWSKRVVRELEVRGVHFA
jgi:hypothetical protein